MSHIVIDFPDEHTAEVVRAWLQHALRAVRIMQRRERDSGAPDRELMANTSVEERGLLVALAAFDGVGDWNGLTARERAQLMRVDNKEES